jgi:hypothetical protein
MIAPRALFHHRNASTAALRYGLGFGVVLEPG